MKERKREKERKKKSSTPEVYEEKS